MKCPTNSPAPTSQVHRFSGQKYGRVACNEIMTLDEGVACCIQKLVSKSPLPSSSIVTKPIFYQSLGSCIYRVLEPKKTWSTNHPGSTFTEPILQPHPTCTALQQTPVWRSSIKLATVEMMTASFLGATCLCRSARFGTGKRGVCHINDSFIWSKDWFFLKLPGVV